MAIAWTDGKKKEFLKIIFLITLCLFVMGIFLMLGSAWLGIPILSLLYGVDLEKYKMELLVMVAGGCFCTFSYVLDNALIVIRKQYLLVCSYVVSWLYVEFAVSPLVEKQNLMGAAVAYATSMIVFFVVTLLIFIICLKKEKNDD